MTLYNFPEASFDFYIAEIWSGKFGTRLIVHVWYYYKILRKEKELSIEDVALKIPSLNVELKIPRIHEVPFEETEYISVSVGPEVVRKLTTYINEYVGEYGAWPEEDVVVNGKLRIVEYKPVGFLGLLSTPEVIKEYDFSWKGKVSLETHML